MCKESVQLEILKRSEKKNKQQTTNNKKQKKKAPARSLFSRNPEEKHFAFFYLALHVHVLGQLQMN